MQSATIGMNNVMVRPFGNLVTIPNHPIAKLMYYLDCISTLIKYDDNTFTDYENYNSLSDEETVSVYILAKLLNPSLFIRANIILLDPSLLLGDSNNQFYEITDETIGVHVNEEIMIGGKSVKVLNVMACNNNWLSTYYYNPINLINRMVEEINRRKQSVSYINTETSMIQESKTKIIPIPDYGIEPVSTICIYCQKPIVTITSASLNCVACCCCLFTNILYLCFQCCTGKNICCVDVTHRCPRCGRFLGKYTAC